MCKEKEELEKWCKPILSDRSFNDIFEDYNHQKLKLVKSLGFITDRELNKYKTSTLVRPLTTYMEQNKEA